jgi:pyruvate carboxylase subunit B
LTEVGLEINDENIFIVAACGDKGVAFLKGDAEMGVRKADPRAAQASDATSGGGAYSVRVDGRSFDVTVDGDQVKVGGKVFEVAVGDGAASSGNQASDAGTQIEVAAHMPGKVIRVAADAGAWVEAGDPVIIIEAMKMEVPVPAPSAGEVAQVNVSVGEQVASGACLALLQPA